MSSAYKAIARSEDGSVAKYLVTDVPDARAAQRLVNDVPGTTVALALVNPQPQPKELE